MPPAVYKPMKLVGERKSRQMPAPSRYGRNPEKSEAKEHETGPTVSFWVINLAHSDVLYALLKAEYPFI